MKHFFILLAFVAASHANTIVVCRDAGIDTVTIQDIQNAIRNKVQRTDLHLDGPAYTNVHVEKCGGTKDVVTFCKGGPYVGSHQAFTSTGGGIICAPANTAYMPNCSFKC
ncbi:uncharacterized protein RAG0_17008 [Rhynchosporium agropyri]|uniref:Uncharacterized protein n=1 Tax=Rhynchosporium agropyri TaxID=914238 RepID=A0A1E1LST1_9HELO|nr:uncharacterized protein RAG0_17008 [Rhynchosporium agropyri]